MTWQKIYPSLQTIAFVGSLSIASGGFWGIAIDALSQFAFGLEKDTALYWIGLPSMMLIIVWTLIYLPKALSEAGIINGETDIFKILCTGFVWGLALAVLGNVVFGLEKNVAIYWVGLPTMIAIAVFGYIYASKYQQLNK